GIGGQAIVPAIRTSSSRRRQGPSPFTGDRSNAHPAWRRPVPLERGRGGDRDSTDAKGISGAVARPAAPTVDRPRSPGRGGPAFTMPCSSTAGLALLEHRGPCLERALRTMPCSSTADVAEGDRLHHAPLEHRVVESVAHPRDAGERL